MIIGYNRRNKGLVMNKNSSISILGSSGMVGSSIKRKLQQEGYSNIYGTSSSTCNLIKTHSLYGEWNGFDNHQYVYMAAAKVGGIQANLDDPVGFGHENMMIILNTLKAAKECNVKKLLYLGSSCIYPAECRQPMREQDILTGPFEKTNATYAFSKAFGIEMCKAYNSQYNTNYIACQPCNIFGPGDNFDPQKSHVVAALLRKFHIAKEQGDKEVVCWGTGEARRELLYVDDLADACLFLMENYNEKDGFVNVGMGFDHSVKQLAEMVRRIVGYKGEIKWDVSKPSGMARKLLNVEKMIHLGWNYKTSLETGLIKTYEWWKKTL